MKKDKTYFLDIRKDNTRSKYIYNKYKQHSQLQMSIRFYCKVRKHDYLNLSLLCFKKYDFLITIGILEKL